MKAKRTEHAIKGVEEGIHISVYDCRDLGELYWGINAYLIGGINYCDWHNLVLAGAILYPGISPGWASDIYKVKAGK